MERERCRCTRSAREDRYTLSEVFAPPRLHTWSRALIGAEAPYCLHVLRDPAAVVVLDRRYKPLAAGVERGGWVDYESYPEHRFEVSGLDLSACAASRPGLGYWLWSGRPPWAGDLELRRYRVTLLRVFGEGGLARLAAVLDRDVGDLSLWGAL